MSKVCAEKHKDTELSRCQVYGMGDVGSAMYELARLSPCLTIRVLSYSNCQRSTRSKWISEIELFKGFCSFSDPSDTGDTCWHLVVTPGISSPYHCPTTSKCLHSSVSTKITSYTYVYFNPFMFGRGHLHPKVSIHDVLRSEILEFFCLWGFCLFFGLLGVGVGEGRWKLSFRAYSAVYLHPETQNSLCTVAETCCKTIAFIMIYMYINSLALFPRYTTLHCTNALLLKS